ncbi:MAG TPA: aquaporin [Candidatus Saccharimonadales bacterium]
MFGRRKVAALVAEFVGTGVLTLVFLSVQRSTIGVPYFVAIAAGLVVVMLTFVVGTVSGGYANPAITLAMWTARKLNTLTAALYIVVQLLGAWAAYGVYTYFVNSSLQAIGGEYTGRVLVAEAIGAFVLALGWGYLTFRARLAVGARAAVLGVSFTLAVIIAAAVGIGIVNPAVALGIRAWEIWGSMGWGTYVLGPVLGAVIGVNLYGLLFAGRDEDETVVVEEVVVTESVVAAPAVAAKRATATKAKKTSTTKKTTTSRAAKKPAAKRKK